VVSPDPDGSAAILTRMARFDASAAEVTWDGVPLTAFPLAAVRERIVLSESTPALFTGTLAAERDLRGHRRPARLPRAMRVRGGPGADRPLGVHARAVHRHARGRARRPRPRDHRAAARGDPRRRRPGRPRLDARRAAGRAHREGPLALRRAAAARRARPRAAH